jgi:hypothetical protein
MGLSSARAVLMPLLNHRKAGSEGVKKTLAPRSLDQALEVGGSFRTK